MSMIKKVVSTVVLLSGMLFAGGNIIAPIEEPVVVAKDTMYVGGSLTTINTENWYNDTTYTLGGSVLGGYSITDFIKAEARVGYIFYEDTETLAASIYVKPQLNGLYGLLGYSYTDTAVDDTSIVYGMGFEVQGVFIDATYRLQTEETLVSLGYLYNF